MPQFPGFIGGSYTPVSYRADVERTVNLYPEIIESKHGPNVGFLRRRPGIEAFIASTVSPTVAQYLLQGGGAGGGGDATNDTGGGAGGGGETLEGTISLAVGSYPVVIGTAGAGGMLIGVAGVASTWNGLTAHGGSPGGGGGADGASGVIGGGGGGDNSTTVGAGGTGTVSNGGAGGSNGGGGGGGSRGSGGSSPGFNTGGNGGAGVFSSLTGTQIGYGGGGGGGAYAIPGTNAYGGGTGAILTGAGGNATANSGAGGGGGRFGFDGGNGAAGAFVIAYPTGAVTATGGTITTVGGTTVHSFTTSGTFAVSAVQPGSVATSGLAIHSCPAQGRTFAVTSTGLLIEVLTDGTTIVRGTVPIGPLLPTMADNGTGHQLIVVSNSTLSLLDLNTNGLSVISAGVIATPVLCAYSDGYFLLLNQTGTLQWSASFDGTTWDGLDIAANSATSDPWVSLLVNHRELWLVGTQTGQVWVDSGDTDTPFELVQGSIFHQGLIAPYTLQRCDNSSFWVGQNEQGRCVVFRASGYTPQRISTHPVEVALGSSDQLENAVSTVFQSEGHTFYVIYVADLETTWVYDVSTEVWTEWAILVDDSVDPWVWAPWPVTASTFAFGRNLVVGLSTGLVGQLTWTTVSTIPAGSLCFTGYGDAGTMRYLSPDGTLLGQPASAPEPGAGTTAIKTLVGTNAIAIVGGNTPNFGSTGTGTFNSDGTFRAQYSTGGTTFAGFGGARDDSGRFYSCKGSGANLLIFQYDAACTLLASWTVAMGFTIGNVQAMGVNGAGTFAYVNVRKFVGPTVAEVYAVNLSGAGTLVGVFASDATSASLQGQTSIIGLTNGDVIIAWKQANNVKRYNAAGTLQATYTLPGSLNPVALAYGATPTTTFWAAAYSSATTFSTTTVYEVQISDGTILNQFDPEDGEFEFDSSFTVLGASMTALIEPAIRWLRRTPHAVNELKRVFYRRLDLLLDTGVGGDSDPVLYMRYSNDGGQTYNTAKSARYGASGQTSQRVYWAPLGSGRDRVFEVYGDDPAPIRIVDAYIDVTPGAS